MRYVELISEDISDDLNALRSERDSLVHHWKTVIEPSKPEPTWMPGVNGNGYPVRNDATDAWHNDPEKGKFWNLQIYPLNQRIEKLEADIKKQRRTGLLKNKRNDSEGFDTTEVLYHGTNEEFEVFDRKKTKTAAHIYTSPDLETSEGYGSHVYAVYGRQEPQAVLTAEDCDYKLLRRVHRNGGFKRGWNLSFAELTDLVTDGQLYNYANSSSLQDDVISTCLDMGFKSVRITDGKPGGGFSDSVIFGDPANLQIIEKIE